MDLIAIGVVALIVGDFIDEEKGKGLNASLEKVTFLLKVGCDGLTDLDTLHGLFATVPIDFTFGDLDAIQEGHCIPEGIYVRYCEILILQKAGFAIQAISLAQLLHHLLDSGTSLYLHL